MHHGHKSYIIENIMFFHVFAMCLFVGFLLMVMSCQDNNIESERVIKGGSRMTTLLQLGRFSFELSTDYYKSGQEQSMYNVSLHTELGSKVSPEQRWQERLALLNNNQVNKVELTRQGELFKGVPAVFYNQQNSAEYATTLLAQKLYNDIILVAQYKGQIGKEESIVKLMKIVFDGFQYGKGAGFSVGDGILVSKPSVNEHARMSFRHMHKQIEMSVSTHTVGNVINEHPLIDIASEKESLAIDDIDLEVLKNEIKTVNKIKGAEGIVSIMDEQGDKRYRFTWFVQGTKGNSLQPEILIKALIPEADFRAFVKDWEILINSFQLR